jgi:Glyoxalase superfamily protein
MGFGKTTPILRIFDEAKARESYVDFLGFRADWEHRFEEGLPLYMQISKDGCIIHLSEHHGDCSPGAAMRIETNDLEAFQEQLLAKDYKYARPRIEETPWGSRDKARQNFLAHRHFWWGREGQATWVAPVAGGLLVSRVNSGSPLHRPWAPVPPPAPDFRYATVWVRLLTCSSWGLRVP